MDACMGRPDRMHTASPPIGPVSLPHQAGVCAQLPQPPPGSPKLHTGGARGGDRGESSAAARLSTLSSHASHTTRTSHRRTSTRALLPHVSADPGSATHATLLSLVLAVHPHHVLAVHPHHVLAVHPHHVLAVHPHHVLAVHPHHAHPHAISSGADSAMAPIPPWR
eukprot:359519-Chlamydomonas_euryale.AAC.5